MKTSTDILIIGAGVSGLSLAHRLQKKGVDVNVLEASNHVGGWVKTLHTDWGLFEAGPRGIRLRGESGYAFLELIEELSLESQLIGASPLAKSRHIFLDDRLEPVEATFWKWPFSKATKGLALSLLKEAFSFDFYNQKNLLNSFQEDISVEAFLSQRFGKDLYRRLFEPALLGVFGAKGSLMSSATCLKIFWEGYQESGSIVRSSLKKVFDFRKKESFDLKGWNKFPLISFQNGLQTFIKALEKQVSSAINPNQKVVKIEWDAIKKVFQVYSTSKIWTANKIVVATSPWSLGRECLNLPAWRHLESYVSPLSLSLLHMGFEKPLKSSWGFGYLVAPCQKTSLLGLVMDSNIFPQHDRGGFSRITAMMPSPDESSSFERYAQKNLEVAKNHLELDEKPLFMRWTLASKALALYRPGFLGARTFLQEEVQNKKWPIEFIGTGYGSFSFSQCLLEAKKTSEKLS